MGSSNVTKTHTSVQQANITKVQIVGVEKHEKGKYCKNFLLAHIPKSSGMDESETNLKLAYTCNWEFG